MIARYFVFIISILLISHQSNAMDKKAVDAPQVFHWPLPSDANTYTDYWIPTELEQDPYVKKLKKSSTFIRSGVFEHVQKLDTLEQQYKAACMVAQAQEILSAREIHRLVETAVKKDLVTFLASISPFHTLDHSVSTYDVYHTRRCDLDPHITSSTGRELPLFFSAKSRKMAKWLCSSNINYNIRAGTDQRTIVHHLCMYTPETVTHSVDKNEAMKLLFILCSKRYGSTSKRCQWLYSFALRCGACCTSIS